MSLSVFGYFKIWMYSSGAEAKLHANPGLYQKLLAEEHDPKLVETIELGKMFAFENTIRTYCGENAETGYINHRLSFQTFRVHFQRTYTSRILPLIPMQRENQCSIYSSL